MLTTLENKLITMGYSSFTNDEKNAFISWVARRNALVMSQVTDEYILNYHKQMKKEQLNIDCENAIVKGFVSSNGHTYRMNRDDQLNMIGQKDQLIMDTTVTEVSWNTEDAGYVTHTRDEWINNVYMEAFNHKKEQLNRYKLLKEKVDAATSHEDLLKITWDMPLN